MLTMEERERMTEYEIATYERAANAMTELVHASGAMSSRAMVSGMLDAFVNEHRTRQQNVVRALVSMFCDWARLIGEERLKWVDARNEVAAEWAVDLAGKAPGFPYI